MCSQEECAVQFEAVAPRSASQSSAVLPLLVLNEQLTTVEKHCFLLDGHFALNFILSYFPLVSVKSSR